MVRSNEQEVSDRWSIDPKLIPGLVVIIIFIVVGLLFGLMKRDGVKDEQQSSLNKNNVTIPDNGKTSNIKGDTQHSPNDSN
jgi:hypothetical protein